MIESSGPLHPATGNHRPLRRVAGAALCAAVAATGVALTTGHASATPAPATAAPSVSAAVLPQSIRAFPTRLVRSCDGGPQKRTITRASNSPLVLQGSQQLTAFTVAGPAKGTDTVIFTFSAEARVSETSSVITPVITVDGKSVTDVGADQLTLAASPEYGSYATQVCVKVRKGNHKVAVKVAVQSDRSADPTGSVDDWMVRADVLD